MLELTSLALLLAHLLADFPLQPNWIAQNKGSRLSALAYHGLIHCGLAIACLAIFGADHLFSWRTQISIAVYVAVHLLLDKARSYISAKTTLGDNLLAFCLEQALHVITLIVTALILTGNNLKSLTPVIDLPLSTRVQVLEIATVYIAVVIPGGHIIRYFTRGFRASIQEEHCEGDFAGTPELKNAGLYIGYLERFLILTAILAKSVTLVGLILTAKSIARFPELKKPSFAEYFLIGTLLSVLLAVLGGLLLQEMIYGAVEFK